jgi:hypothetical protein
VSGGPVAIESVAQSIDGRRGESPCRYGVAHRASPSANSAGTTTNLTRRIGWSPCASSRALSRGRNCCCAPERARNRPSDDPPRRASGEMMELVAAGAERQDRPGSSLASCWTRAQEVGYGVAQRAGPRPRRLIGTDRTTQPRVRRARRYTVRVVLMRRSLLGGITARSVVNDIIHRVPSSRRTIRYVTRADLRKLL